MLEIALVFILYQCKGMFEKTFMNSIFMQQSVFCIKYFGAVSLFYANSKILFSNRLAGKYIKILIF